MKAFVIGFAILSTIIVFMGIFYTLKGVKGQGNDLKEIKDWTSRDAWSGEISQATLINWKQANATHNFDYYFILTLETNIQGQPKQYQAAAVVKVADVPRLKKNLPVTIKYSGVPPKKMAVLDIEFEPVAVQP